MFPWEKACQLDHKTDPKKIQNTRQNMEEAKNNIAVFTVKKKIIPPCTRLRDDMTPPCHDI
jgi:hypothetical protein